MNIIEIETYVNRCGGCYMMPEFCRLDGTASPRRSRIKAVVSGLTLSLGPAGGGRAPEPPT